MQGKSKLCRGDRALFSKSHFKAGDSSHLGVNQDFESLGLYRFAAAHHLPCFNAIMLRSGAISLSIARVRIEMVG